MKVLFRAEVKSIVKLAESQIKLLKGIEGKFYAIGFESDLDGEFGITDSKGYYWVCKKETRAIHIEGMLDSENNKIFASLSDDGKGGSKCLMQSGKIYTALYNTQNMDFDFGNVCAMYSNHSFVKVVGVQQ